MKGKLLGVAILSALIVIDVLWLRSIHMAMPVLLIPSVLVIAPWTWRWSLGAAVWLGLLQEALALQPFGVYLVITLGMMLLARAIYGYGVRPDSVPSISGMSMILLFWHYLCLFIAAAIVQWSQIALVPLLPLIGWQLILTALVSFWVVRLSPRIIKV